MKLRIMHFDLSYVELDMPENFDLNMCAQSTKAVGFFCDGRVFIPYEDIKAMFSYKNEAEPPTHGHLRVVK